MPSHVGGFTPKLRGVGIVVARFNEFITRRLLESAEETFLQAGVPASKIHVAWVPGALEVPLFCKKMARAGKFDVIVALACVLRGSTYHFECVSNEITRGIAQVSLEFDIPIASGVITADNLEQAIDRAGLKAGNKGAHAALAALEIASLDKKLAKAKFTSRI